MIYTSTKALQFLSVPVYTIFKNLTIIVIAYGEVLWFGGRVSPMALLSFGLMVLSSVVAAWADIQSALAGDFGMGDTSTAVATLNAGYAWMGMNVFCSASYVLGMRKAMKKLNLKDSDSKCWHFPRSNFAVKLLVCLQTTQHRCTTICCPSRFYSSVAFLRKTGVRPTSPRTSPSSRATE
jgi:UDP-galactose transporter